MFRSFGQYSLQLLIIIKYADINTSPSTGARLSKGTTSPDGPPRLCRDSSHPRVGIERLALTRWTEEGCCGQTLEPNRIGHDIRATGQRRFIITSKDSPACLATSDSRRGTRSIYSETRTRPPKVVAGLAGNEELEVSCSRERIGSMAGNVIPVTPQHNHQHSTRLCG